MSVVGRHVARARGRALGAVGAPRVPNLPSGRALARRELREAVQLGRSGPRRRSGGSGTDGSGTDGDRPARSGDVSTPWLPSVVALVGVALAAYLLVATGVPDPPPARPTSCYDRVVHLGARLSECRVGAP